MGEGGKKQHSLQEWEQIAALSGGGFGRRNRRRVRNGAECGGVVFS